MTVEASTTPRKHGLLYSPIFRWRSWTTLRELVKFGGHEIDFRPWLAIVPEPHLARIKQLCETRYVTLPRDQLLHTIARDLEDVTQVRVPFEHFTGQPREIQAARRNYDGDRYPRQDGMEVHAVTLLIDGAPFLFREQPNDVDDLQYAVMDDAQAELDPCAPPIVATFVVAPGKFSDRLLAIDERTGLAVFQAGEIPTRARWDPTGWDPF